MKSHIAIACIAACSLAAPGAALAWGNKATQSNADTTSTTTNATHSRSAGTAVSDAAITTKVKSEMAAAKDVSAMNIKVDTDNGVVNLSGTAKSRAEADKAVSIAKNTGGVVSVNNNIQVARSQ
jgi:hyperosmotically inducible periplasmic protein